MSNQYQLNPPTVSAYAEHLMLKLLFEHKGFPEIFRENGWRDDNIAMALGLPPEMENINNVRAVVKELLQTRYKETNFSEDVSERWKMAYQNIEKLSEIVELNEAEKSIFRFIFHLRAEKQMKDLMCYLPHINLSQTIEIVADILSLSKDDVRKVFSKKQKLFAYGLMEFSYSPDRLEEYLGWGDTLDFDDFLTQPLTEEMLLARCTLPTEKPTLSLSHFEHIKSTYELMLSHLKFSIDNAKKGTNILIYGSPGTGKTELAGLLSEALNVSSYTMTYMDEDDDVLGGKRRLENCRLAQRLLRDKSAIIIFDEIEDVFASSFMERSVAQENKAWVNQFLENNDVPMIWLSNSVSCIDNAYLRRFDLVFEMPDLPFSHKEKLIRSIVNEQLSHDYIRHFSQVKALSPAIITRGLTVMKQVYSDCSQEDFAEKTLNWFNQMLKSQGFKKIEPLVEGKISYNLDWIACNDDIHKITEGLKRTKRGRICCYGPPGTGKTAWANWLGQELGMSVLVCHGSDLLDMYVGGTEKKIAQAFAQAKENNMVLVFDEVDTFLFARESGQRSWERSQVNEMLTQIEKFEGLLVVSTNLMDGLDPAALRRFDLKLHFNYLKPEQAIKFAQEQVNKLNLPALTDVEQARIAQLRNLTPGDFAAVARRHRFAPFDNLDEWLKAIKAECEIKQGKVARRIGF
ncbi:ATP-binding protein [Glaesserella parasuis]|uniref:AAA family ATPase n=1 Tax=Glaesserella parasuis TaxID=738 RepID=UPI0021BDD6F6|nr:ATP-binding protein [Glaesserella parasuis]MCT8579265.1 ATP-binding protein [Glaesserella parasuis]MCT8593593.1 ATP-binding protein [Glaesserella parasuis]MCT8716055.1 ATP-binding protein [Glaesserella parasuis]MCT8718052.1 ATP-binding protein [Glaesserella parasuis]MCT8722280.1 ATP-binding protein [Glaesserella parasuis]